jgi:adenylate cyclase
LASNGESKARVSLAQLLVLSGASAAALVLMLFYGFVSTSREEILTASEKVRAATALRIQAFIRRDFSEADQPFSDLGQEIARSEVDPRDPASAEAMLFREMIRHDRFAELTFTAARRIGFDASGDAILDPDGRWQVSLLRPNGAPTGVIETRKVEQRDGGFVREIRTRTSSGALLESPLRSDGVASDPTLHLTFKTTASASTAGGAIWSDLAYAEGDALLPAAQRRVVVTEQQVILDRDQNFAGVLRVALLTQTVDAIANARDLIDPHHRVFIADDEGRLVSRLGPTDPIVESGEDLRVAPRRMPPEIARSLASSAVRELSEDAPTSAAQLSVGGLPYLLTTRLLPDTQGWIVGIVVPESAYVADLERLRFRFEMGFLAAIGVLFAGGGFVLRALRRSLGALVETTDRMERFDFEPTPARLAFSDVQGVLGGLERAKTALRALEKYVPIDLVRELYRENKESVLGAELRELSILFSDIEGFTSKAETLEPGRLAAQLGLYLAVMSRAIEDQRGTIDKFIGDAVMAFWNAPKLVGPHGLLACTAALECVRRTNELFASPEWGGMAPFKTRFGIHKDRVLVGNFGAPARLNYTVLGDGVNLAARLEGLNKQYGTTIIVSQAIQEEARQAFTFRLLDKVAVKGRSSGVLIYELVGRVGEPVVEHVARYEEAFSAYLRRDFAGAIAILESQASDGPSRTLIGRCRLYASSPPPAEWDGTSVATSK